MRAAVLQAPGQTPGYREHPAPEPPPGHALVRVTAAPIAPLDLLCASGTSYFGRPATPYVPGVQGVGVVERSAVLPEGARVFFATRAGMAPGDGSLAELCAVPEADLVLLSADVPDAELAALGMSGVAAWMCLTARGRLRPGERVLVLGAGGAVGQAAVGAAKLLGAGRVVAVARSPEARERARRAGADEVVELAGDVDELTVRFRDALGGDVDVVVDPVFGTAATAASRVLATGGRLVNLGGSSGDLAEFSSAVLRGRAADVLGYTNNVLTRDQRDGALAALAEHAARGRLRVAHQVLPLAEVADAWRRQAAGETGGRLVLTP
ncbi:zinc-binding alcohol dehydrogenase family protein [Geodermatophilus sp. YIM 151500]|uniref:quinone oxidoreductase family protein n=1 Tax=Geodermatophilus sp. YIM 151500 TaxID=2984531 RepID=UPI0021E471AF|nr:zinc-binding alcohol dehydrogenase family protein [Geodermatophilus sp. YIM 151500]MCV2490628.1 zinc-binding alcohol dehydrogenase family protein [Geodermatophilus sp. YIM 151500]